MRLGLDVGRHAVKMVRVDAGRRPGDAPRSVRAAMRPLDPKLSGPAAREARVAAIRACADELGGAGAQVAVAIPRAEAVVKTVTLPNVPPEERARLIRFQAAKDIPFEPNEVVLASGLVGAARGPATEATAAKGPVEVVYAAVRTVVLDELRALVLSAGLRPTSLELSTQAAARAVRLLFPEAVDAALVLVGALSSDVVILRGGRLVFSRSASVGAARDPLETGEAEANRWLDRLGAEIARSVQASGHASEVKQLLLAGGAAKDPSVAATLAARLGLPSRVVEGVDGAPGGSSFLVARGLADARPVDGIPSLDLAGHADAQQALSTRRRAVLLGGLSIALVATIVTVIRNEVVTAEQSADRLEKQVKALKPEVDATKALQHQVQVARSWTDRKSRALDILLSVSRALPSSDAYLTRLQWNEGRSVLLSGRARDSEAISSKFVKKLNHDPLVQLATFEQMRISEGKKDEVEAKGNDFQVSVKLRELTGERAR